MVVCEDTDNGETKKGCHTEALEVWGKGLYAHASSISA